MTRLSPTIALGKTIRLVARLRGGGSALPGLVVERLQPGFLATVLGQLPHGVVLVTGTNGKTTTTKMITELLRANGLRVLTNHTGSNFTRGIIATLLEVMNMDGSLDYDIAVLELDEAYAKHFVDKVSPQIVVVLNIMRDQLDRFGEIDATARLLRPVLESATQACIVNRDDPLLLPLAQKLAMPERPIHYFGVAPALRTLFPTDNELQARGKTTARATSAEGVELEAINGQRVTFTIGKHSLAATLQLNGHYNFQNAAAALATVKAVLPKVSDTSLVAALANVQPAFGRGEKLMVHGQPVELVLVKNPAGFRLSLSSFVKSGQQYMIAINDQYADGRDMSWLWDVDFGLLSGAGVSMVSGLRAYDMALRLQYDEALITRVEPKLGPALKHFLLHTEATPKVIFCTYTAMLGLRRELKKYAQVERVL